MGEQLFKVRSSEGDAPRYVWVAAAGAVLALVSYVLPWFTLGDVTFSGINFAENPPAEPQRGAYLLLLAAAVTFIGCFFRWRGDVTSRSSMAILAAGVLGFVVSLIFLLTALLQPTLTGWVTSVSQGASKPNPKLFGLGELQGLGAGLFGSILGYAAVSWAGWSGTRSAGGLAAEAPPEAVLAGGNPTVRRVVMAGLLGGIAWFLGVTRLGFIPFPTGINATIMHIPAIIAGIVGGWPVGWAVGTIFGVSSFLAAPIPLFKDPLVAIVPRMFIGVTAYYAWQALRRANYTMALVVAAVLGTMTNTILVLTAATTLHPDIMNPALALTIAFTQGILEAILAPIIVLPIMDAIGGRARRRKSTI